MDKYIKELELLAEDELTCDVCGKRLNEDPDNVNVVLIENKDRNHVDEVYVVCKGRCDDRIQPSSRSEQTDGWIALNELYNPYIFIRKLMAITNNLQNTPGYFSAKAYKRLIDVILVAYQYVARKATDEEKHRDDLLQQLPF